MSAAPVTPASRSCASVIRKRYTPSNLAPGARAGLPQGVGKLAGASRLSARIASMMLAVCSSLSSSAVTGAAACSSAVELLVAGQDDPAPARAERLGGLRVGRAFPGSPTSRVCAAASVEHPALRGIEPVVGLVGDDERVDLRVERHVPGRRPAGLEEVGRVERRMVARVRLVVVHARPERREHRRRRIRGRRPDRLGRRSRRAPAAASRARTGAAAPRGTARCRARRPCRARPSGRRRHRTRPRRRAARRW